jgi:hypothetical protein
VAELTPRNAMNRDQAGLNKDGTTPGAERLLAELVKRGLRPPHLKAAAALALALDERR